MPVSQAMPAAATAMPSGMTGFGPNRGHQHRWWPSWAATIRAPTIGRKARPVLIGLKPRFSWR